jgi:hypothetical protein
MGKTISKKQLMATNSLYMVVAAIDDDKPEVNMVTSRDAAFLSAIEMASDSVGYATVYELADGELLELETWVDGER